MLRLALLSAVVLVGVTGAPRNVETTNGRRIVNGTDAAPGQFPFQISLQYDYEHVCGGTILSSKWILTAAHCVEDEVATYYSVLAGTNVLSQGGERRHVLRYKIHPNYDPENNYENDIAVVELESPLSMTGYMAAVTLPSRSQITAGGLTSTVIGWGHLFVRMPNVYVRKSNKGSWSEEDLRRATEVIKNDSFTIRAASRQFNIPESTLRNRLKRNVSEKHALGPDSQLGVDTEKKLAHHIKKLQAVGFAPTQRDVRIMAYSLAETLGIKHTFNTEQKMAGKVWFASFMRRNRDLSVRKSQGISRARTEGMNREEVKNYFSLFTSILTENDLLRKPGCIWNCDEIGLQLNNEPGKVIAAKGSKDVHVVTSAEKGETITILACCNAEGQFVPPYCIFKGVYAKPQYERGVPPGSVMKMRRESAYSSSKLFMDWMTQHFIPRKPPGKNLLILDGHSSHMNSPDMLQVAADNDVIILCLPSHTTHYLQPLDRVVFKPFKTYLKDACGKLVTARQGTGRITREDFGELLNSAWSRAANVQLATSAFRATGIYPLNIDAIPEHAYSLSCDVDAQQGHTEHPHTPSTPSVTTPSSPSVPTTTSAQIPVSPESTPTTSTVPSMVNLHPSSDILPNCQPSTSTQAKVTPTKVLEQISPIPHSLEPSKAKRKQSATNVTDPEYINTQKEKKEVQERKRKKNEAALKKKKTAKDKTKQGVTVRSRQSKLTRSDCEVTAI